MKGRSQCLNDTPEAPSGSKVKKEDLHALSQIYTQIMYKIMYKMEYLGTWRLIKEQLMFR